ncbi:MAG: hypothetical protein E6R05_01250 [Candidatus Moraniibacteriota bacterium]|nr:MAG: hypothetical protein E6R05_01250 [Candidatus Moranbacteria bacterium]
MILVNEMEKASLLQATSYKLLLLLLSPFAPHIVEELWHALGEKQSIFLATWPKYDAKKIVAETVKIAVQVNGKVRTTLLLDPKASEEAARALALADEKVKMHLADKTIRKVIYIPGKIVSIVVG